MEYSVEYRTGRISLADFRRKYQERDKYMAFCRECPRYNTVWSCPPLAFNVNAFLEQFIWANILCAKIVLSDHAIAAADTSDKIKAVGWDILSTVKLDIDTIMRRIAHGLARGLKAAPFYQKFFLIIT